MVAVRSAVLPTVVRLYFSDGGTLMLVAKHREMTYEARHGPGIVKQGRWRHPVILGKPLRQLPSKFVCPLDNGSLHGSIHYSPLGGLVSRAWVRSTLNAG